MSEPDHWEPVERVEVMSDEAVRYTEFGALAKLVMSWRDGFRDHANNTAKASPNLSAFLEGASFAFHMTWWLLAEQAQTYAGGVGPDKYAPALLNPVMDMIKGYAAAAKAAYELGGSDAATILNGKNNGGGR